jgi:hypothetical protein
MMAAISRLEMPFIQLPYVIVSRFDYDWLVFSRNVLIFTCAVLICVLWDKTRKKDE